MSTKNNKNKEIFAKRLKAFRKSKQLTQVELSEKIGIGRGVIAYYESCAKNPTIDTLQKFADFFDVPVTEFLEEPVKAEHPGRTSKLERQIKKIKELSPARQRMISNALDALISG